MRRARILYDADCGFCRFSLAVVLAWDRRRRLEPVTLQSTEADRLLATMAPAERMASWHLVDADGSVASAGAALAPLLRSLPAGRPAAWVAARAPRAAERGYRYVADRRSALGRALPAAAKRWADRRIAGAAGRPPQAAAATFGRARRLVRTAGSTIRAKKPPV